MQTDFSRALTLLSSFDIIGDILSENRSLVHAHWREIVPLIVDWEQYCRTASSLLFFFAKLLQAKPKYASGEAACGEKRVRKPEKKKKETFFFF